MSEAFDDLSEDERTLLAAIPDEGERTPNYNVIERLGWVENRYWEVRNSLIRKGILYAGRGRGGTVGRVVPEPVKPPANSPATTPATDNAPPQSPSGAVDNEAEQGLYGSILGVLKNAWAKHQDLRSFWATIVASQGRRQTGGRWTRPDLVVVAVHTFDHVPGKHLDIWTFEVKPNLDVLGVYEAAAHKRAATYSYLMFPIPEGDAGRDLTRTDDYERIVAECQRLGVGLYVFERADDYNTYDEVVPAERENPDPSYLEEFILRQLPEDIRTQIRREIR